MLVTGLAVGTFAVLICYSTAGQKIKDLLPLPKIVLELLDCPLCTSCWITVPLAHGLIEWGAIVAIANITVFLMTLGVEDEETDDLLPDPPEQTPR